MYATREELRSVLDQLGAELLKRKGSKPRKGSLPMIDGESMLGDLDLPYSSMPQTQKYKWIRTELDR